MNFHYQFVNYLSMICMGIISIMNGCFLIFCPEKMLNGTRLATHHCMYEYQMLITTSVALLILAILLLIAIFTVERIRIPAMCISIASSVPFVIWYIIVDFRSVCTKEISEPISASIVIVGSLTLIGILGCVGWLILKLILNTINIYCPSEYSCRCRTSKNITQDLIEEDLV